MPHDAWLYGTKKKREAVRKAAVKSKGLFDAASDDAFQYLAENPSERATRSKITHWGGQASDSVSVIKAKGAADGDDPPSSRQLKDPFTTFYVQGMALEPPLPPERLLNLTEENVIHAACIQAKATDACGRGWSFETDDEVADDAEAVKSPIPKQLKQTMEDLTPDLTFTELLEQAAWETQAIGWGVWEAVRTSNDGTPGKHGDIGALYPIPSHTIRACIDPRKWVQIRAGRVRYFKKFGAECTIHNETGEILEWKGKNSRRAGEVPDDNVASELIVFKTYSPRSLWYGVPRWLPAIATIAELGAIREFNVSWFASGGQVDYHMHFTAASVEMATMMKEQVEEQVREFAGRGHTNILTAGDESTEVTVQKLGELLREGHFRFRRGDLVKEVLIAHATPPYRIGWAETGPVHRETEVLMRTGWERIDRTAVGDDVLAWVPDQPGSRWPRTSSVPGRFEFQRVEATHRRRYETLLAFSRDRAGFEIVVSADHRMVVRRGSGKRLKWMPAGELADRILSGDAARRWRVPVTAACDDLDAEGGWTEDEAALAGWLAAEGSLRRRGGQRGGGHEVSLFQNPGSRAEKIDALLDRLMVPHSKTVVVKEEGSGHYPNGRPRKRGECMAFNLLGEKKREWYDRMRGKKRVPEPIFESPLKVKLACLEALILGDGSTTKTVKGAEIDIGRTAWQFGSADRGLADDVMRLATLCGLGARIYERPDRPGEWVVAGRVSVSRDRRVTRVREVQYSDDAFCLTVSSGAMLYRWKGVSYIAGNSLGGNAAPEMLAAYKVGAVEPIQRVIEDRLRSTLFDPKTGIKTGAFRLKLAELDLENLEKELEKVKVGVDEAVITPNQGRKMLRLTPVDDKPEMDEYYYHGTKLGSPPPAPPGGDIGGFGGASGGNPDGSVGQFDEDPYAEAEDQQLAEKKRKRGDGAATRAAKRVVVAMLRDYETKLKSALAEGDVEKHP